MKRIAAPALAVLALAGCSSGHGVSAPSITTTQAAPVGTAATTTAPAVPSSVGKAVTVTYQGYVFDVALASPGVTTATTFTTNDSSGSGGRPIDAPPGQTLLVATLNFANNAGREEPLMPVDDGTLPSTDVNPMLDFMVPTRDATAFGITGADAYHISCDNSVVGGYCSLGASEVAFSPAQTDIVAPPEVATGTSGTITILPVGVSMNFAVPQDAPIKDVKLYVETDLNCAATLGTPSPGCMVALN